MTALPSISCLVAAYNYEQYVGLAIESVLSQDYPPELLEIVVVDDGSTDGTADVVRRLASTADGRVRLIQQPNRGLKAATELALEHATGQLIGICDADDEWLAGKARAQAELFAADPRVTLSYGDVRVIDGQGELVDPSFFSKLGVTPEEGRILETLLDQNIVPNPTLMVRADTVRPYPARMPFQDYWLVANAAAAGHARVVNGPLANYRSHGANMGFGSTGDAEIRKLSRELLGRRLLIAELAPSASANALAQIVARLVAKAIWVSTLGSVTVEDVLDVAPDERARAATELECALKARDAEQRIRSLAVAVALDPFNAAARDALIPELSARMPEPAVTARPSTRVLESADPLVSVVVPAYNNARFLGAAIDSVLAQSDPGGAIELIVVDDGSTDDTPAVLARYGDRIRSVRQPNRGLVGAIDTALGLVNGSYVALLDSDDEWPVDRLARHVAALRAWPEVGLVHGDMELIDTEGRITHPSFFDHAGLAAPDGRVLGELLSGNFVSGGASTFRAALLPAVHPLPALAAYPDWSIAACVASVAELRTVPGSANRYRFHGNNMGLGSDAGAQPRIQRLELPWRRWMYTNLLDDATITAAHLQRAHASLRFALLAAASREPSGARALLEADPAAAAGLIDGCPGPGPGARRSRVLLRALAHDPFDGAIAIDLELALQRELQLPTVPSPPALITLATRGHLCLAWLDEVVAAPGLLQSFARDPGRDDTTLAVLAPHGADLTALVRIVESDPLLSSEASDLTVISEPATSPARALLSARAETALTRTVHPHPFAQLPVHPAAERVITTV